MQGDVAPEWDRRFHLGLSLKEEVGSQPWECHGYRGGEDLQGPEPLDIQSLPYLSLVLACLESLCVTQAVVLDSLKTADVEFAHDCVLTALSGSLSLKALPELHREDRPLASFSVPVIEQENAGL